MWGATEKLYYENWDKYKEVHIIFQWNNIYMKENYSMEDAG